MTDDLKCMADNDGTGIAYERRARAGDDADWLVLVHGLGYGRWGWEPIVGPLAADFRLILIDNRGIGDSDVPPGPYTTAQMAGDVVAVLDDAEIARAHLLGASLGGMIVQEVALTAADRVDRVVLACTTPGGEIAHPLPLVTQQLLTRMPTMEPQEALRAAISNALSPRFADDHAEVIETILGHRLANPQDPAGWLAQAAAGATHDAAARLGLMTSPTLVIHGDADVVVDPRNAQLLGDLIPEATVEMVTGAGHLLFWEQPDTFVRCLREFLLIA